MLLLPSIVLLFATSACAVPVSPFVEYGHLPSALKHASGVATPAGSGGINYDGLTPPTSASPPAWWTTTKAYTSKTSNFLKDASTKLGNNLKKIGSDVGGAADSYANELFGSRPAYEGPMWRTDARTGEFVTYFPSEAERARIDQRIREVIASGRHPGARDLYGDRYGDRGVERGSTGSSRG